jgi:hypothetical protein
LPFPTESDADRLERNPEISPSDVFFIFVEDSGQAEKYLGVTPYAYTLNRPTTLIDLFGMSSANPNDVAEEKRQEREARRESQDSDYQARQIVSDMAKGLAHDETANKPSSGKTTGNERPSGNNSELDALIESLPPVPVFNIYRSRYEGIFWHHVYAFSVRKISNFMTYEPVNADKRSKQALNGIPTRYPDYHRDEIPYKTTLEGGFNASVAYVLADENARHGADYSSFLSKNNIKPGQIFSVHLVDDVDNKKPSPVPLPHPSFAPFPKKNLFDLFQRSPVYQFNNPLLFLPFTQGLEWELNSLPKNNQTTKMN